MITFSARPHPQAATAGRCRPPGRSWFARAWLALFSVTLLGALTTGLVVTTAPPAAAAKATTIAVTVQTSATGITVAGSLTEKDGPPLAGKAILIELSTGLRAQVATNDKGEYRYDAALPANAAPIGVAVAFAGDADFAPVGTTATGTAPTPAGPADTALTARPSTTTAVTGRFFAISGTLTSAGAPVQQATVHAEHNGQPIGLEGVTTATGAYSLQVQVPADAQPGPFALVVMFPGSTAFKPAQTQVTVTLPQATSAPPPPASPEASSAPSTVITAPEQASSEASAPAPTTTSTPASTTGGGTSASSLIVIVFAIVIGLGLLMSLAWLGLNSRRNADEDDSGDHFIDD